MSLRGMWALWAVFVMLARRDGFAPAYGWFYVSTQMTLKYHLEMAYGQPSSLPLMEME